MDDFELAIAKSMTQTKLDPLGSAAILLKLALTVYHDHLKDKYAVEEVIFHALKTIDNDWFDDQNVEDILSDMFTMCRLKKQEWFVDDKGNKDMSYKCTYEHPQDLPDLIMTTGPRYQCPRNIQCKVK